MMKDGGVVEGTKKDLKVIVKELLKASKMHKGQSKRIDKHIKMMKDGGKVSSNNFFNFPTTDARSKK